MDKARLTPESMAALALWLFATAPVFYAVALTTGYFGSARRFLLVAALLALAVGIVGWSQKHGKVAVIGAAVLAIWASTTLFLCPTTTPNALERAAIKVMMPFRPRPPNPSVQPDAASRDDGRHD